MESKEEILESIAEKAHESLIDVGRRAEQMDLMRLNTAQNPAPNNENKALRAMQKIDPYAHLRDKTQMRKVNGRWSLMQTN
jgi:hypothetical protein